MLRIDEINILCEALDSWIDKGAAGEMMGELLGSMLSNKVSPEAKAKMEQEGRERKRRMHEEKEIRKRTATILKAKLYQMELTQQHD